MPKGWIWFLRPTRRGPAGTQREGSATEQLLDAGVVGAGELDLVVEPPRPLARLVLEPVIAVGAAAHQLARSGDAEALRGAALGLGLGHGMTLDRSRVGGWWGVAAGWVVRRRRWVGGRASPMGGGGGVRQGRARRPGPPDACAGRRPSSCCGRPASARPRRSRARRSRRPVAATVGSRVRAGTARGRGT